MLQLKSVTTSQILYVMITDTTGAGKTGLTYATSGLVISYTREGAATVAVTKVTQTPTGAWSSGGFVEMDATNAPGLYRIDIPDAALAAGVKSVTIAGAYSGGAVISRTVQFLGYNPLTDITTTILGYIDTALSALATSAALAAVSTLVSTIGATVAATLASVVSGTTLTIQRGDTLTATFSDLTSITGYDSLIFTMKTDPGHDDDEAVLQIRLDDPSADDGLLVFLAAPAVDASQGFLTVLSSTSVKVTLAAAYAAQFAVLRGGVYDLQMDISGTITTLTAGQFTVNADVTRATS